MLSMLVRLIVKCFNVYIFLGTPSKMLGGSLHRFKCWKSKSPAKHCQSFGGYFLVIKHGWRINHDFWLSFPLKAPLSSGISLKHLWWPPEGPAEACWSCQHFYEIMRETMGFHHILEAKVIWNQGAVRDASSSTKPELELFIGDWWTSTQGSWTCLNQKRIPWNTWILTHAHIQHTQNRYRNQSSLFNFP